VVLFIWMIFPLLRTIYFSFMRYNLQRPDTYGFWGWASISTTHFSLLTRLSGPRSINTLLLVGGVLLITIIGGILLGMLLDQPIFGQGIVRILVISPFFVMPPVAALVWKNMILSPGYGVAADIAKFFGVAPVDWFAQLSAVLGHHDRGLAVAALRNADPAYRAAVA
jgi:sorbitol/mannitol transport system permease protein